LARKAYVSLTGSPRFSQAAMQRTLRAVGGPNAWLEVYGLMSMSKLRFFGPQLRAALADHDPYEDLAPTLDRVRRWHPLNRSLYWGARIHLPGLLLSLKGDRIAMHSSVETRYPFLDEEVFQFLARIHPRWKMKGFRDKHILRVLGERWLPRAIARRKKAMFRAPFDSFFNDNVPTFIDQLLSEESLRKTGYFDVQAVQSWRQRFRGYRAGSFQRTTTEMGLVGVVATQLWHHTFLDGSLADLPSQAITERPLLATA